MYAVWFPCCGKHEGLTDHSGAFQRLLGHRTIRVQNQSDSFTEILSRLVQSRSLRVGAREFHYQCNITLWHFHE